MLPVSTRKGCHPDRAVETNRLAVHGGFVGHVGRGEPHRVTELLKPGLVGPWKVDRHRPRAICNDPTHGRKAEP